MHKSAGTKKLSNEDIDHIRGLVRSKHNELNKLNDIIGSQIFSILELNSRVLYYPLEEDDVSGFAEKIKGQSFVCINTSIPYDKQVFAAAHELYHLWFNGDKELILSSTLEDNPFDTDSPKSINELKANRFAAEFLVEENLLRQEMHTYSIKKDQIEIKDVLKLSSLFVVPYKTMTRRLYEIGMITEKEFNNYYSIPNSELENWRKRLSITLPTRDNKIALANLVDIAMESYEKELITIEKLEELLSYQNLTPEMVGIDIHEKYIPLSEEEIDKMMED